LFVFILRAGAKSTDFKKWRMASSGMLRRVALVRTDVSEELSASIDTSVFTRATLRNIPEDTSLHSQFLLASLIHLLRFYFQADKTVVALIDRMVDSNEMKNYENFRFAFCVFPRFIGESVETDMEVRALSRFSTCFLTSFYELWLSNG
jgi:hypothetical protein